VSDDNVAALAVHLMVNTALLNDGRTPPAAH
jgi:hypothetical protein